MSSNVVIVGAGFGGLSVARKLKKASARVTIIDRSNHHLFQPLLYQVATAGLSPANIAVPIRSVLKNQINTDVLLDEVVGVDAAQKQVQLKSDRKIKYDYLVLATGSRHSYFGHNEWEAVAPGLKSVEDAVHIRRKVLLAFEAAEMETDPKIKDTLLTFIVIGGGPTGVELAGAIAELSRFVLRSDFRHIDPKSARVILLEAGPRILSSFPESLSMKARDELKRLGVEVRTGARVASVDPQGVVISPDSRLSARTVVWAAGVGASPVGKWLSLETDKTGRVKVLPNLTIPGHPEIFVIGDAAYLEQNGKPLPGLAPVAMQEGRYVASVILKKIESPFEYRDKGNLATVGRSFAVADLGKFKLSGGFAWLAWVVVHIYYLISFRNKVFVLIEWAWYYFTYKRGARLITNL